MTYNEWRDELKSNLLSVSESERRRVLDYYAEAYADRRDAGFTEREIIEDFGAPYDAAQKILSENNEYFSEEPRFKDKKAKKERKYEESYYEAPRYEQRRYEQPRYEEPVKQEKKGVSAVCVLLFILFAIPVLIAVISVTATGVGVIIGLCTVPVVGCVKVVAGIVEMFSSPLSGLISLAEGIIVLGVGIILIPLVVKFMKLCYKLAGKFFRGVKNLFLGKERA